MFPFNNNDVVGNAMLQLEKENYIVDMLIHTLYSNDVNNAECYHIVKLFNERVLGNTIHR